MARPENEAPNDFARLVATYVKRAMGEHGLTGRKLAVVIGRSEKYTRERVSMKYQFELNDIEAFCAHIGVSPEDFIANVERDAALADVVPLRKSDREELDEESLAASDRPYQAEQERQSEDT